MKKEEVLKLTVDDWHPNFEGNKVKLIYHGMLPISKVYRVSLWGNDDYGLYKDYDSEEAAIIAYLFLKRLPFIGKIDAWIQGFEQF